jgi:hypothetical protein
MEGNYVVESFEDYINDYEFEEPSNLNEPNKSE